MAVGLQYALRRLRRGGEEQINALYKDVFMGGSNASIVRWTKQIAVTLGVSLVVLGSQWEPLRPYVCKMPFIDCDEVGKSKKLYIRISLWEGCILVPTG